ncbi:hypothetical protein BMS3Abin02_00357 [bacterium BMS3Abin02]|nr:hypothetical protein BMS3Abin02_00357 [bacterium BMS3Abin02]
MRLSRSSRGRRGRGDRAAGCGRSTVGVEAAAGGWSSPCRAAWRSSHGETRPGWLGGRRQLPDRDLRKVARTRCRWFRKRCSAAGVSTWIAVRSAPTTSRRPMPNTGPTKCSDQVILCAPTSSVDPNSQKGVRPFGQVEQTPIVRGMQLVRGSDPLSSTTPVLVTLHGNNPIEPLRERGVSCCVRHGLPSGRASGDDARVGSRHRAQTSQVLTRHGR